MIFIGIYGQFESPNVVCTLKSIFLAELTKGSRDEMVYPRIVYSLGSCITC